jgi:transposase
MLGIDVSKRTLTATLLDPTTRQVQWELEVPHTDAGVARLLARSPLTVPWVLEPTGRWSLNVARQATAAQRSVLLAQPRKAKAFLSSLSSRAKTDRIDSRGLAVYGLQCEPRTLPDQE